MDNPCKWHQNMARTIFSRWRRGKRNYTLQCTKMCHGKSTKDIRNLGYELQLICGIAGTETRASKAVDYLGLLLSFNMFLYFLITYSTHWKGLERFKNRLNTATYTVYKPKVVAEDGTKQVSQCKSAEKGCLVTTSCIKMLLEMPSLQLWFSHGNSLRNTWLLGFH